MADGEEAPSWAHARTLVQRWMEWVSVLLLCDRYDRGVELDLRLEEAMRQAMTQPMGYAGWRAVFEALLDGPRVEAVLGLDPSRELPADHPVATAIWSASGDPDVRVDLVHLVRAVSEPDNFRDDAAPAVVAAIAALVDESPALSRFQPVKVVRVQGLPTGGCKVRYRPLVGTGWPSTKVVDLAGSARMAAGQILFWDGADRRVDAPAWLLRVDPESQELMLYDGREPETRAWRFVSARPNSGVRRETRLGGEAPVILAEPTWRTPAPASRRVTPEPATLGSARASLPPTSRASATAPTMAPEADVLPRPARYLLTVLGGRSYLRFCELSDDDSVVMGRNPAFAGFVIHHGEVSRSNTRVWTTATGDLYVQDLRSTNGSTLNDEPIGSDPERVKVGDVIGVGPVAVGVSWWDEADVARLRRLIPLPNDKDRDPLTGLYTPAWLQDMNAHNRGAGFGSSEADVGLLLVVDRLGALHAQHGAEVADTVFQNTARALLSRLAAPAIGVRVGYGELLALLPNGKLAEAENLGGDLIRWAGDHRWEGKGLEVALTGATGARGPSESTDAWVGRLRTAASEGRKNKGKSRIYSARS